MKIVYLLRYYPTLTETFVYDEIKALCAEQFTIHIVSMGRRGDGHKADQLPNVTTTFVPRARRHRYYFSKTSGVHFLKQHQRSKDIARYRWLRDKMAELAPDVIHAHFAGEAAEWAYALQIDLGIPCCITAHAVDIFRPQASLPVLLNNTNFRCISQFGISYLEKRYTMTRPPTYVPCAIDIPKQFTDLPTDRLRALFIGRDVPKKGLSILLDAWKEGLDSHQLTLVTETERSLPEGVTCIGFQPPSGIPEIIEQHNLLVLPCQIAPDGDMDGIPIVFMESLSRGRPVLSTSVSGIPELVTPEVGWLLKDASVKHLHEKLETLSRNLNTLVKIGKNGPEHLRKSGFCRQKQMVKLIDWILNVTV